MIVGAPQHPIASLHWQPGMVSQACWPAEPGPLFGQTKPRGGGVSGSGGLHNVESHCSQMPSALPQSCVTCRRNSQWTSAKELAETGERLLVTWYVQLENAASLGL